MTTDEIRKENINRVIDVTLRIILKDLETGTASASTGLLMTGLGHLIASQKFVGIEKIMEITLKEFMSELISDLRRNRVR